MQGLAWGLAHARAGSARQPLPRPLRWRVALRCGRRHLRLGRESRTLDEGRQRHLVRRPRGGRARCRKMNNSRSKRRALWRGAALALILNAGVVEAQQQEGMLESSALIVERSSARRHASQRALSLLDCWEFAGSRGGAVVSSRSSILAAPEQSFLSREASTVSMSALSGHQAGRAMEGVRTSVCPAPPQAAQQWAPLPATRLLADRPPLPRL